MEQFNLLMTLTLADISTFLMSEPIKYFVGLALLAFVAKIALMLMGIRSRV